MRAAGLRLFIGLELPPACKETLRALNPDLPGLRWLPPEQMHMTLSFLGDVSPAAQESLEEALRIIKVPPFILPLQGVGTFGGRRPSVVWVGVGKGHPHVFALHQRIQNAVLSVGLAADLRPFHPHVTVARGKGISIEQLRPFLKKHHNAEFGLFEVTGFVLFSSLLAPEGATYFPELRVDWAAE